MNYVESFDLFGVPARQIPCIPNAGAPTTATEGAVGDLYMDTITGDLYKCTAVADGIYTWEEVRTGSALVRNESSTAELSNKYDLKGGYSYTEDVYIEEDGTETALTGQNFKCVDYIPVNAGTEYTMFGVGYALYDENKTFVSAVIDAVGANAIREFTPNVNGYVRLTINSVDITYARFCRTSEKYRERREYEPPINPFIDPCFPCEVHLYGDSNSSGEELAKERDPANQKEDATDEDKAKAWSNRLGALIMSLPDTFRSYSFSCFAEKEDNAYTHLKESGYARMTAYTTEFFVRVYLAGEVSVLIDGQEVESITSVGASGGVTSKTYTVAEGYHTIELYGEEGTNTLLDITTKKSRSFQNHAVHGTTSLQLPATPEGSIAIVMYGGNDFSLQLGATLEYVWRFWRKCKAAGIIPYIFTSAPRPDVEVNGECANMARVVPQYPPDCINIYTDLQVLEALVQHLGGESLYYSDNIHLNEKGHKLLYSLAAGKLQLAALNSEIGLGPSDIDTAIDNIIATQEEYIGGATV